MGLFSFGRGIKIGLAIGGLILHYRERCISQVSQHLYAYMICITAGESEADVCQRSVKAGGRNRSPLLCPLNLIPSLELPVAKALANNRTCIRLPSLMPLATMKLFIMSRSLGTQVSFRH